MDISLMHLYIGGFFVLVIAILAWFTVSIIRADPMRKMKKPYNTIQKIELTPQTKAGKDLNYVDRLTEAIEDISKKAKSIKDDTIRAYWLDYVQELRIRQLKVLQEIQDKEYRDLQQNDFKYLTDSDIRSRSAEVLRNVELASSRVR